MLKTMAAVWTFEINLYSLKLNRTKYQLDKLQHISISMLLNCLNEKKVVPKSYKCQCHVVSTADKTATPSHAPL